jgi:hypothetical protein
MDDFMMDIMATGSQGDREGRPYQATGSQGDREGRPYKKTREMDAVRVLVRATLAVALQAD